MAEHKRAYAGTRNQMAELRKAGWERSSSGTKSFTHKTGAQVFMNTCGLWTAIRVNKKKDVRTYRNTAMAWALEEDKEEETKP